MTMAYSCGLYWIVELLFEYSRVICGDRELNHVTPTCYRSTPWQQTGSTKRIINCYRGEPHRTLILQHQ